jgi:hypothetical protein
MSLRLILNYAGILASQDTPLGMRNYSQLAQKKRRPKGRRFTVSSIKKRYPYFPPGALGGRAG